MKPNSDHPHKLKYNNEKDPNKQSQRISVNGLYVSKSKARLEVMADRPLLTRKAVMEALEQFKPALLDRQIKALTDFYG